MTHTEQTLKFGKFKGQKFNETPAWYQEWLMKQDWFNKPQPARYDVVKKYERDYAYNVRGGKFYDVEYSGLDFDTATELANGMNCSGMNETVDCYFVRPSYN
jgi:hypothetical protein